MPNPRARLVAAALLLTAVAGCSGGDPGPARTSSPAKASSSSASPFVVAAAAVGTRSRTQVVSLHAMGTSTTTDGGVPHAELPAQGAALEAALLRQVGEAVRLPPPAGSPSARLITSLRTYAGLAGRLAAWDPSGAALPSSWFTLLRSTDAGWTTAMQALSTATGRDLLADLPTLSLPAGS